MDETELVGVDQKVFPPKKYFFCNKVSLQNQNRLIWTERRLSKLVLNVKYLLLLSFLTENEFYNLRHNQGIIKVP